MYEQNICAVQATGTRHISSNTLILALADLQTLGTAAWRKRMQATSLLSFHVLHVIASSIAPNEGSSPPHVVTLWYDITRYPFLHQQIMPACCPAFNVFCTKGKCSLPARKHGIEHPLVGTLRLRIGPDHLLSMSAVQAARLHNPTYFHMIEHTCIILDVLLRLSFSLFVLTTLPTNICRSQLLLYSASPCDRMQVLWDWSLKQTFLRSRYLNLPSGNLT